MNPIMVACRVLLILFLLVPFSSSWSQQLTGRVLHGNGQALAGAHVYVPTLMQGTVTDSAGFYALDGLPLGSLAVEYRFVGFTTVFRSVSIGNGRVSIDITLEPDNLELQELVALAEGPGAELNRATLSVSSLEPEDLEELRGQTLAETLSHLAGVTTLTTGPSIAKPVIRGMHSQRVLVLNAGVPQEGQQWGGEHAPEIDPFAPVRIEVVRGAAGVEYGVGAIGGVIRLEPRNLPVMPRLKGSVSMNGFSNNRQAAGSALLESAIGALPGLGWRVQGSFRKAGASKTPDYVIGNSGFSELNGSLALGYKKDNFALRSYYSLFSTELGLFKGAHIGNLDDLKRAIRRGEPSVQYEFLYDIDAPKQTVRHDLFTLSGHYDLDSGDRIEAQFGLQQNRRQEFDAHRRFSDPLEDPAFDLTLTTRTLDVKLRSAPRGSFFRRFGIEWYEPGQR